jgi:quaternary ammonium compound-resistance protein SugE
VSAGAPVTIFDIDEDRIMAWAYLLIAGLFEVGWPVGLKMAQQPETRVTGIVVAVVFMAASGILLWLAQKEIPIGTSYAVWTGIGAAGTFVVGVVFYGDPTSLGRYIGVALIVAGVAALKLSH